MMLSTTRWRWLLMAVVFIGFTGTAHAQRNVTLRLNTATIPDTIRTDSHVDVRGEIEGTFPVTLFDGNVIDYSAATTLVMDNAGGDYWDITFQIHDTTRLTFKYFSQQAEDAQLNGWEAAPNPVLEPGSNDTTLTLHYFEWQGQYRDYPPQDKGPYDWRPWEQKEDTVAVYFRVFMNTEDAVGNAGYDRDDESQIVGVRGDNLGGAGPLDWGATYQLQPELEEPGNSGYHIYSGVAYYPASLAGTVQPYKFFVEPAGWEAGDDRTFTVPAQDTTLHWTYFSRSRPLDQEPVESLVIFTVDLSPFEEIGLFDVARGDTLWVFGGFNGWQDCPNIDPDQCLMQREPGAARFETAIPLSLVPGQTITYKYFLDFNDQPFRDVYGVDPPSGWEEGHATGIDRATEFTGEPQQDVGIAYFNDITSANVIPEGTSIDVHFAVDMSPAYDYEAQPFDPEAGDSVTIRIGDPIWAFTQGITESRDESDFPLLIDRLVLTDDDDDDVYEGTLTVVGPTYSAITFRYVYGQGTTFTEDQGLGTGTTPGRNRAYYIRPDEGGSWPSEYSLPQGAFQIASGPLPFEENPAFSVAIEEIAGELPTQIKLDQNYPNPFNPSTTFEYAIDQAQHVRIRVYDVTGRVVATLVDGVLPAATYRVTFNGDDLASGMYMYQLETPTRTITRKMMLIK